MQVKIWNRDGTIYKNLDRVNINSISVKNGGSFVAQNFEDIIGKYASFELSNGLDGGISDYNYRFSLGIITDYTAQNGRFTYKVIDIMKDLERGYLDGGYETGSGTISTLTGNIITRYNSTNSGINLFYSVTISPAIAGTFYYTKQDNCYLAFKELVNQMPSTATYMINFINKGVETALNIQFGNTGNTFNLYYGKGALEQFIINYDYTLSRETLANKVFYYDSAGTLLGNVADATSVTNYGQKVKVLKFDTNDGSETAKAQQFLDKYKNPIPIINNLTVNILGNLYTRIFVGDTIKIMSEGIKNDIFINNTFLVQDIIYNGSSNNYNLIIGDIINNDYLK